MPLHVLPQDPQLVRSIFKSLHPVEHWVSPVAHTQAPALQRGWSLGQTLPQLPQLFGSLPNNTHAPAHSEPVAHSHAESRQI